MTGRAPHRVYATAAMLAAMCCSFGAGAQVAGAPLPLGLAEAVDLTLSTHPELRIYSSTERRLAAERDVAALRAPRSLEAEVENLGHTSGDAAGEVTLSLASVLERGGKREARIAVAASRLDALTLLREQTRLDLIAEAARRYLDVVRAQDQVTLSAAEVAQRVRTVEAAAQRVQAGASPESVRLTAEAAQARAQLEQARADRDRTAAYRRLALLWGERSPALRAVEGDLTSLPDVPTPEALAELIQNTPDLARFADEQRLREARLQLARATRQRDVNWRVGVRHLQEGDDWVAVGAVAFPLGSARRAEPEIRSAEAELDALAIERQSAELSLYATLVEAHGLYLGSKAEVEQSQAELVPRLETAATAAERAYRAGALSYLEWAQVQSEMIVAREEQLDAAREAQLALIEIQRLTGEPFIETGTEGGR
jgi:cobalt-zinc-cadmium efflux system outer membrane protein